MYASLGVSAFQGPLIELFLLIRQCNPSFGFLPDLKLMLSPFLCRQAAAYLTEILTRLRRTISRTAPMACSTVIAAGSLPTSS